MEDGAERRRPWLVLFLVGVALHAYAAHNSDLGLDAHVRLNVVNDETNPGFDAPWGAPRVSGDASEPSAASFDGYVPPWNTTEASMKITAVSALLIVGLLVSLKRTDAGSMRLDFMWGAMLFLSPVMMFSTSRGYDEAPLALLMALSVAGYGLNLVDSRAQLRIHSLLMATSLLLVMGWKGFELTTCFGVWLTVLLVAEGWMALLAKADGERLSWLVHPWKMGALSSLLVVAGVCLVGVGSSSGTFSVVSDRPLLFLVAVAFALFDALVLYLLVGCLLWPTVVRRWTALRNLRGPAPTMLTVFISGVLTGVVLYIAALWTLESSLWGIGLAETMVVLGNNGRYATLLLVPVLVLLKSVEPEPSPSTSGWTTTLTAVALVLPFLLFTTFVGHQVWSVDAGEQLAEVWQEEDQSFLVVAPQSMAMHHMYAMKSHVDLDGSMNVTGYWSTPQNASERIDAGFVVDYLIVSPNADFMANDEHWDLIETSPVPVNVPGGIQSGHWSLYRANG